LNHAAKEHNTSNHSAVVGTGPNRYGKDEEDDLTISYGGNGVGGFTGTSAAYRDSALDRNKRERIKQLKAPHVIMQE
jgi:hypothetical protein